MIDDTARIKMMANKLFNEVAHGRIDNDFAEAFITSVKPMLDCGKQLSEKQIFKLEELFERY